MMKGGVCDLTIVRDLTIHHKRIRSNGIESDEGWCVI